MTNTSLFPSDHFVDEDVLQLISYINDDSPNDFHSAEPQQLMMGSVMYFMMVLKWVNRYENISGRPAWVATRTGRRVLESFHREAVAEAKDKAEAEALFAADNEAMADAVAQVEAEAEADAEAIPMA
jgi:hypothetical protein